MKHIMTFLAFLVLLSVELNSTAHLQDMSVNEYELLLEVGHHDSEVLAQIKELEALSNHSNPVLKLVKCEALLSLYHLEEVQLSLDSLQAMRLTPDLHNWVIINRAKLLRYRKQKKQANDLLLTQVEGTKHYLGQRNEMMFHKEMALLEYSKAKYSKSLTHLAMSKSALPHLSFADSLTYLRASSYIFERINNDKNVVDDVTQAVEICEKHGLNSRQLLFKFTLGKMLLRQEQYAKSIEYFEDILNADSDIYFISALHNNLGVAYKSFNEFDSALHHFYSALDLAKKSRNTITTLINIGNVHREKENWNLALEYYFKAEQKATNSILPKYTSIVHLNRALLYEKRSQRRKAIDYANQSLINLKSSPELIEHIVTANRVIYENSKWLGHTSQAFAALEDLRNSEKEFRSMEESRSLAEFHAMQDYYQISEELNKSKHLVKEKEMLIQSSHRLMMFVGSIVLLSIIFLIIIFRKEKEKLRLRKEKLEANLKIQNTYFDLSKEELKHSTMATISMELHDNILSALSGSRLISEQIVKGLENKKKVNKIIELSKTQQSTLHKTYQNLREYIITLRTGKAMQVESDIINDLSDFIEFTLRPHNIQTSFKITDIEDLSKLPDDVQIQITRVVKEILNNIIKHAKCTQVAVKISWIHNQFSISIFDNGIGIEDTSLESSTGGIKNIRDRVQKIDGTCNFFSRAHEGTLIEIHIPINQ